MKTIHKNKILTILVVAIAMIIPSVAMAQSDGGKKKKKKAKTEQTMQTKKPSKSKTVKVSEPDGYINDHGYVDLGLPSGLKWATCNVGASTPSGYGSYFAWGETTPKSSYTEENSKTEGRILGDISGCPSFDAAHANWGDEWRLPTKSECQELVDECKWTWTTSEGRRGCKVTGPNGNSIFLPAAGVRIKTWLSCEDISGQYSSSTPSEEYANIAYCIDFNDSSHSVRQGSRFGGNCVRPVTE